MRKALLTLILFTSSLATPVMAAKNNESFLVTVGERKISVQSPTTPKQVVTVVVKNDTFDKIVSEIRNGSITLQRFVLEPSGKKGAVFTITVDISKAKNLQYVSIAPPFQEVPLSFSKEEYEIP